jgi:hypothetical protein
LSQVEDDNPYRDKSEPPRKFWRNTVEVETFEDADVRQLSDHGWAPGKQFQLRVPMKDPETGRDTDADGDPALLRIAMVGGELDFRFGNPTFKGFVSFRELEHEKAYRSGDLDACLESYDKASDNQFVIEEWQVL